VGRIPQQDSAERAFNKLARTFAAQLEALKRYRGGGEQTMPRGVATARGRRLDGGSSRLDLSARRTSMTTSDRDPGYRASSAGIVPMSAFGGKADIDRKCGHVRYWTQSGHGRFKIAAVQTDA
jgi:hypothetical protein